MKPGHYIEVCSCGVVLAQCRCPDPHKERRVKVNGCPRCQALAAAKVKKPVRTRSTP